MLPITGTDVSLAVSALSLSGLLYTNRGNLPLRRAQTENTQIGSLRNLIDTYRAEVDRLSARLTRLEAAQAVIAAWVRTLASDVVPADVRTALQADHAGDELSCGR